MQPMVFSLAEMDFSSTSLSNAMVDEFYYCRALFIAVTRETRLKPKCIESWKLNPHKVISSIKGDSPWFQLCSSQEEEPQE